MSLQVGIVGLPNVGKSTLFNAVSAAGAEAANYPFATIEPNVGVVPVPDERLDTLARLADSARVVPTSVEFHDIAGLVAGASRGEGLGNQFLAHIREVACVAHVVRCFADPGVTHVSGSVDPVRDIEVVETELLLADIATLSRRVDKAQRTARAGDRDAARHADICARLLDHLDSGEPARTFGSAADERALLAELSLLTAKPVLYVANVGEADLADLAGAADGAAAGHVAAVEALADKVGAEVVVVCAEAEAQIAELDPAGRAEFLTDLGLSTSGLDQLVHAAYRLLGLVTFFTAGPTETRAWTVRAGASAREAAGCIHSDMERGFIRAETIDFADYAALGSEAAVKQAGRLRVEGKDYVVRDGDVMLFRFNV